MGTTEQFIKEIAPLIQKYAPQYGIKVVSPILAQAILESASGTSELAVKAHNYFGMKYKESVSGNNYYIKVGSEQTASGNYVSSVMKWCKFDTSTDCVVGYFKFISASRYANLKDITDPQKYLETIKADGYATSLKYVSNLMAVIQKYNLTQYDPKSSTPTVSEKKCFHRVQTGSYSVKANADKMMAKLKADGYNSILKFDGKIYRIQVGAFSLKSGAENLAKQLESKGYKTYIVYN